MITIYNSNLDFDLDSSYSITLSSTSNMVFKTNGTDKMSIVNNGISVSGNVVVSGLITSTGAGFSGIGANLTNIPISAINELRLELNGGTTELSVTRDTLNATIVSEAKFGSNYTNRINNELNTRVDNTSNYVLATSNILIGRIINTSNYIDSTSNFLSGRLDNTSNYVLATSNILIGRIINTSNYVDSTSNFLGGRIDNTSNYVFATSNILIGRIINTSNYVDSTSNLLAGRIDNTSNYVFATSNILIGRVINASNYTESTSNILIGRVINASNYVESTSNILMGRVINTSNYTESTSNILIGRIINASNYVDSTSNLLAGRIDNTSNYVFATSNILIGRLINTSNYIDSTSNFLGGRIDNTSNYVFATSNILIGRLINTCNYVDSTSNFLGGRIDNTCNYVFATSNILIGRVINASNYVESTSNTLIGRVINASNYVESTSNTLIGRVINASNYVESTSNILIERLISTSNLLAGRIDNTSNYVFATSNILIGRLINTSNYVDSTNNFLSGRIDNTSNYVFATSNILVGRVVHTSNYVSSYKPATAVRADTADKFTTSRRIANIPFDGSADISISYSDLNNQLSFGNGLSTSYDNTTKITSVTANAAPQEQSDWTQTSTSSASFIKNKPTIPANTFQLNGANIFYNSGNVGIGTNATPLSLLEIITANYTGALLTLDAGIVNSTTQMPRSIGRPLLKLGKTCYSTSAGDYYGIGFGISPTLNDYNCAEIGTIITSTTGLETGDIIFSTRPGTNNVIATERMRIASNGNVAIGTTDTATYKLNVAGDVNISAGSSFRVGGNTLSTFTPSSGNLIGVFNSAQFENANSLINIKTSWKPSTAGTADAVAWSGISGIPSTWTDSQIPSLAISKTSGLQTALDAKQPTLTSTNTFGVFNTGHFTNSANLININGSFKPSTAGTADTANALASGTSISTNTITASGLITANNNVIVNGTIDIVKVSALGEKTDLLNTRFDTSWGLKIQQNYTGTGNIQYDFIHRYNSGNYNLLTFRGNCIGIGNITPGYLLDVGAGNGILESGVNSAYISYSDGTSVKLAVNANAFGSISAKFTGAVWCNTYLLASSDVRIKEDIQDINDDSALQMILAIEPKTYKYIDKIQRGDKKVYGFIAQQIRGVIPEATTIEKSYIPNIMLLANYNNNIITLSGIPTNIIIKINDKIKCFDKVNKEVFVEVVEIIDEKTFLIKNIVYDNDVIFVYGTEIDDFHTISKEYIFTLNVCATQELHRRIISQEERIKELEAKVNIILNAMK